MVSTQARGVGKVIHADRLVQMGLGKAHRLGDGRAARRAVVPFIYAEVFVQPHGQTVRQRRGVIRIADCVAQAL